MTRRKARVFKTTDLWPDAPWIVQFACGPALPYQTWREAYSSACRHEGWHRLDDELTGILAATERGA